MGIQNTANGGDGATEARGSHKAETTGFNSQPRSHSVPRLHGNGFIQWDLGAGARLHVWSKRFVPTAQKVPTPIHDHTFSFESRVLKGMLYNKAYRLIGGADYRVFRAVPHKGEDTRLIGDDAMWVGVREHGSQIVGAGVSYTFPAGMFHESIPMTDPVITVMRKTDEGAAIGRHVLVPVGTEPDNDFDRYQYDTAQLIEAVVLAIGADVVSL